MSEFAPIPPLTVVRSKAGEMFRIGYYSKQDGLDCVWLVNKSGEYEQTGDQKWIAEEFEVITKSNETDFFGVDREIIGAIEKNAD